VDQRLLVVDDDADSAATLRAELASKNLELVTERSPDAALQRLAREDFGLVLCDVDVCGPAAFDFCRQVVALREGTPVIMSAASPTIAATVAALRAGAHDFVTKPFDRVDLGQTIDRAMQRRAIGEDVKRLRRGDGSQRPFDTIVGDSVAMRSMYDLIVRVAGSDTTVLVTGESGTGKELVARALHARSPRSAAPFVAINCAAMPESLLESELFGHVKGAFTDARGGRPGLFTRASGGTLLLDEVGEMPVGMQAKLLRALQERTLRPVGSDEEIPFDTRIIAATNRDLEAEVAAGSFREDLFYRLNVLHIRVPPLRDRGSDVLLIAQHCLRTCQGDSPRVVGFTRAAAEAILAYEWPGNVRELHNCMERAVALARFDHVGIDDLPERLSGAHGTRIPIEVDPKKLLSMDEVERRYIRCVLEATGGNKASAARVLGFDRRTLYRKLGRWGESVPASKSNGDAAAE
jgi:two-component system, NtrC family, response regulator AtoC